MAAALAIARSLRRPTVSNERSSSQQVNGSRWLPSVVRSSRSGWISSARPLTPPARRSLCPPQYLVSDVMHRSAPSAIGRWKIGPKSVLSTTTSGRGESSAARRTTSAMSTIAAVGLAGVSMTISLSGPAARAAWIAARIAPSSQPSLNGTLATPRPGISIWL